MRCETVWERLSAYADGEATPSETAIVEAHIAVCLSAPRTGVHARVVAALLGVSDVEPPVTLRAAILAATVDHKPLRARFAERCAQRSRRRPSA